MIKALAILLAAGLMIGNLSPWAIPQVEDAKQIGQGAQPKKQVRAISVSDLTEQPVVGWLGHPLGKIVTIEGLIADEDYRKMKVDLGHILLRVQTVNGKPLKEEEIFHFEPFRWAEVEKPKVGAKFKYTGYETGSFTGVPAEAFKYVPPVATTGYGFTTSFVILRDELKRK